MILEFCACGDLKTYIEKHAESFILDEDIDKQHGLFDNRILLKWAVQVARGMHFLGKKGVGNTSVYHGDLALRNVLITEDLTAKVSDFGLAKRLYRQRELPSSLPKDKKLPIRWMALELLDGGGQATIKSDVWSFGVLMWEMFTLGALPYPIGEFLVSSRAR